MFGNERVLETISARRNNPSANEHENGSGSCTQNALSDNGHANEKKISLGYCSQNRKELLMLLFLSLGDRFRHFLQLLP